MDHLYASVVRVERLQLSVTAGVPSMAWSVVEGGEYVPCRLDLNFVRPGKDIPAAPVAGKAPDRIGVMFYSPYEVIRAGDRVVTIPGDDGEMPVVGTFEIRVIPDTAIDYSSAHHIEVQILETNQVLVDSWPDDTEVDGSAPEEP